MPGREHRRTERTERKAFGGSAPESSSLALALRRKRKQERSKTLGVRAPCSTAGSQAVVGCVPSELWAQAWCTLVPPASFTTVVHHPPDVLPSYFRTKLMYIFAAVGLWTVACLAATGVIHGEWRLEALAPVSPPAPLPPYVASRYMRTTVTKGDVLVRCVLGSACRCAV